MVQSEMPILPNGAKPINNLPEFRYIKGVAIDKDGAIYSCRCNGSINGSFKTVWLRHKARLDSKGYVRLALPVGGKRKDFRVHILVAKLFLDKVDGKRFVNHKDGDRTNNKVDNLEWCTHSENIKHSFDYLERKRIKGSNSPKSKLTESNVKEIWRLLNSGIPMRKIAAKFNVHHSIIDGIKQGKRWKHVKEAA